MATAWENVLQQALALPPHERATVVVAIEKSIGEVEWPPHEVAADDAAAIRNNELVDELKRRSAAYREGTSIAVPSADVLRELGKQQNAEDAE